MNLLSNLATGPLRADHDQLVRVLIGFDRLLDDSVRHGAVVDDLALDSLDWVDLALQLEESLRIPLREQRFASVHTVQDIVDHVRAALDHEKRDSSM